MTTLSLDLAKELQSVCKEKNITMPPAYNFQSFIMGGLKHSVSSSGLTTHKINFYTLDELLLWLPNKMQDKYGDYVLQVTKIDGGYDVGYNKDYANTPSFATEWDPNPCNAAGKLLIYLIQEGII